MRNEFKLHKRSDAIKWAIVFTLIAVLIAGMVLGVLELFTPYKPSEWFTGVNNQSDQAADGETESEMPTVESKVLLSENTDGSVSALSSNSSTPDYSLEMTDKIYNKFYTNSTVEEMVSDGLPSVYLSVFKQSSIPDSVVQTDFGTSVFPSTNSLVSDETTFSVTLYQDSDSSDYAVLKFNRSKSGKQNIDCLEIKHKIDNFKTYSYYFAVSYALNVGTMGSLGRSFFFVIPSSLAKKMCLSVLDENFNPTGSYTLNSSFSFSGIFNSGFFYRIRCNEIAAYTSIGNSISFSKFKSCLSKGQFGGGTLKGYINLFNNEFISVEETNNSDFRYAITEKTVLIAVTEENESNIQLMTPPSPPDELHKFYGWYYDEAFTKPYCGEPVTEDINLYARFVPDPCIITLDVNGGDALENLSVSYGTATSSITFPTPTKKGHTFTGWTEITESNIYTNYTLTASWTANTYTVKFVSEDNEISSTEITFGTSITLPEAPLKTGYNFIGWYTNEDMQIDESLVYDYDTDMTFTAKFEIIMLTVTFKVNSEDYKKVTVPYGSSLLVVFEKADIRLTSLKSLQLLNSVGGVGDATVADDQTIPDVLTKDVRAEVGLSELDKAKDKTVSWFQNAWNAVCEHFAVNWKWWVLGGSCAVALAVVGIVLKFALKRR